MYSMIEGKEPAKFVFKPKDDSAASLEEQATGYYSYLAGRSDSEILSDGYTVADYRTDRVIGESVYEVISKINLVDMSSSDADAKLDELYQSGLNTINTIYSTKYTSEMTEKLNDAYRTLEISENATDDEVRQAYKRMALKYHPDRIASQGEEARKAAERAFQQINQAKDIIYKARGLK